MSQTPVTSDSPIFNRLVEEFAAKGAVYEEFIKWSTPAFSWGGRRGVKLAKTEPVIQPVLSESSKEMIDQVVKGDAGTFGMGFPAKVEPEIKQFLEEATPVANDTSALLRDYIALVGQEFAERHPLAIVTDAHTEMNNDGSATVVVEAVQPITSVKPLSERNTAEPME